MDTDANQLARTHIDDVEQLLRTNSSLHANEVDSLLSEINDFLHLRSRELSKGKSVNYMDVLEAIDECGSPSEIVKQYLEINTNEINRPFKPLKERLSAFSTKKGIRRFFPQRLTKIKRDNKPDGRIPLKSLSSNLTQAGKTDNIRYQTHSIYKKFEYKKKLEKWLFLSCISIIGMLWIPFLAFYWLLSFRNVEIKFMKSWEENENFSSIFPYQPDFRTLFTQNQTYQTNLRRINRIKILLMLILIIPFLGYFILFFALGVMTLFTLGMAPLLAYYYLRGPKRHINILIEREYQLKSEKSNKFNYLAFYNKAGYLSFDFDITTKIMREINLSKEETIQGIYQSGVKMIQSSFVIITNQNIIDYSPSIIFGYGDRIHYLPKNQVTSYHFRKKRGKMTLIIESVEGGSFIIGGLDRKVLEPIHNVMNLLELRHKKPDIRRLVQKKRKQIVSPGVESFICQECESQQASTTPNLRCDTCGRYVCIECFYQMTHEGITHCPKCEGSLVSQ
ncbi:MAG: hypothetical protein ACW97W_00760 [Candidatus Hodarchaeales archaeon]